MVNVVSESGFGASFCDATKSARQNAGFTQETMAVRLGVARGTYELYECRSPLPHELIKPFCKLAKIGPAELYKGTLARLADLHPKEREWLHGEGCSRN